VSGILGAFKDAIEQTFNDLSERGDISPERARDAARDAMKRAQDAMEDMRGRVDFVTRREFDALRVSHHGPASGRNDRARPGRAPAAAAVGDGSPGL
jgi:hypothetical protein